MEGIIAVVLFICTLFFWRTRFVITGNLKFWQLVTKKPDEAYLWMQTRNDWILISQDDPESNEIEIDSQFVGPFKLVVPCENNTLYRLYVNRTTLHESERDFIEKYGTRRENERFPWLSSLLLLYPISAMISISYQGAPFLIILGYGFANLGYLLFGAGLLVGKFGILGFRYRIPTLIAAVCVWIFGMILSNIDILLGL